MFKVFALFDRISAGYMYVFLYIARNVSQIKKDVKSLLWQYKNRSIVLANEYTRKSQQS